MVTSLAHQDDDGYVSLFSTSHDLEEWLEPATVEDTRAIFDDTGMFYSFEAGRLTPRDVDILRAQAILKDHMRRFGQAHDSGVRAMHQALDVGGPSEFR